METTGDGPESVGARRMRWSIGIGIVLLLLLVARLLYIQGIDVEGYAEKAVQGREVPVDLAPERGAILDRDNQVLADSVQRYNLVVNQQAVDDYQVQNDKTGEYTDVSIDESIDELAEVLDIDKDDLEPLMYGDRQYRVVTRSVTPEVKEEAMDLEIPGLRAEPVADRHYPNGAVAGSLLGFISADGEPLEGLEASQNNHLGGEAGELIYEQSADGIRIPNASFAETPAVEGQDVRLTVDQDVQWFAQEAIAKKVDEYSAEWGNIVVQDVDTGDIVAMADSTTVDPSDYNETDPLFWSPTAVTQAYEPGSTGKVATFAAALNEGVVEPEDKFTVPNKQEFDGEVINDSMPHDTYDMTTAGIFTRSYNTGTVQVANEMSNQERFDYLQKFGIGEPINLGLPYAASGTLAEPDNWDGRQQYTTSFGQGYSVTTLHTAQMFQTIANGGERLSPQLIDAYIDDDGTEHQAEREDPVNVVSEETSAEMLKLMEGVVHEGTGFDAKIPGYRVGGKTGTGQAAGEGGYDGYTTSFTAVAPLDDPQFVVSVAVHRPEGEWETWHVTDTAGDVMQYALNKYNVPPSGDDPDYYDVFTEDPQERPW